MPLDSEALVAVLTMILAIGPAAAQAPQERSDGPRLAPGIPARLGEADPPAALETVPAPRPVPAPVACAATISGFAPLAPVLPAQNARTPEELAGFLEGVSGTPDGTFEVVLGEGRVLTLKEDFVAANKPRPVIAVGDPSVADFIVVGARQLRVVGQRLGTTDLSITTPLGKVFTFQVQVVADLTVLRCQLRALFPDAGLKLAQLKDHVVVEGQARDIAQAARILQTIRAYLISVQATESRKVTGQSALAGTPGRSTPPGPAAPGPERIPPPAGAAPASNPPGAPSAPPPPGADVAVEPGQLTVTATIAEPQIINLIRVVGSQQILLKVRVAELNRTAMREIGADILGVDPESGAIVGTQIGGAGISGSATATRAGLSGTATATVAPSTTVFGIFQEGDFAVFLRALRRNLLLKTLAEPNLVTMNGHQASFLAGGEFPVPVPQVGASGVAPTITVQFREFGVRLGFVPFILDGDVIRLTVDPEVSNVDPSLGTTLVAGGSPVPGLNTRKAHTTVELRQGQTLMIAGLMQLSLDAQTTRIPGLGDLPILGPFFSNTTHSRIEKELVVLVTPYLVEPLNPDQVGRTPGDEVNEPNDLELYFLGRLEGRTGREVRSTTMYDDPLHLIHHVNLEKNQFAGPCGYSD